MRSGLCDGPVRSRVVGEAGLPSTGDQGRPVGGSGEKGSKVARAGNSHILRPEHNAFRMINCP